MERLKREKQEKKEQLRQLEKEVAELDKEMAALADKGLAVRDAWWMQLYHQQQWDTLAEEIQQAGAEDEQEGGHEDEREWDDPEQVQELIEEEMGYVMGRIY